MAEKADNKAIGISFILSGVGLAVSLGLTIGWIFAVAGAGLIIVGLTYITKEEDEA